MSKKRADMSYPEQQRADLNPDHGYTEVDYLACVMECGTIAQCISENQGNSEPYWVDIGHWFKHHYPDRYITVANHINRHTSGEFYTAQLEFMYALWFWLQENNDGA